MMTPAEKAQLLAGYALHMELADRGIACGVDNRPDDAPCVRVAGITALEAVPLADGRFELWQVGSSLAPLAADLSLDEAAALLATIEGRA